MQPLLANPDPTITTHIPVSLDLTTAPICTVAVDCSGRKHNVTKRGNKKPRASQPSFRATTAGVTSRTRSTTSRHQSAHAAPETGNKHTKPASVNRQNKRCKFVVMILCFTLSTKEM